MAKTVIARRMAKVWNLIVSDVLDQSKKTESSEKPEGEEDLIENTNDSQMMRILEGRQAPIYLLHHSIFFYLLFSLHHWTSPSPAWNLQAYF